MLLHALLCIRQVQEWLVALVISVLTLDSIVHRMRHFVGLRHLAKVVLFLSVLCCPLIVLMQVAILPLALSELE